MRRSRLTVVLWISLLGLGFSLGLQKIRTFDYWWQLRTGALILGTAASAAAIAVLALLTLEVARDGFFQRMGSFREAELLVQVGDLRWEAGDREEATGLYDRALEANADFAYASFRRAMAAENEGDLEMATRLYGRVLALSNPGDPVALLASGRLVALSGTL